MTPPTERQPSGGAEDPRIRRSWLIFGGTFLALGLISVIRPVVQGIGPIDIAVVMLILLVGLASVRHRAAVRELEAGRRAEAESFARILQGLSRSISPDAIVAAIVEELGTGTGADHVVIVRRRPDARVLEATLVNARTGVSTSSTLFPIGDLEDPPDERVGSLGHEPIAIPIEVDDASNSLPRAVASGIETGSLDLGTGRTRRSGRRAPALAPAADVVAGGTRSLSVANSGRLGWVRDVDPERLVAERLAHRARLVFGLRHTLVVPLSTEQGMIGALLVSRRTAGGWPASAHRILVGAAIEASAALSRAYSHRRAEARAATDGLTGLPNRRYFDEFCALLARRRRAEDSVGVLMIDIDKFKALNDRHGHQVGDEVLRAVAGAIVGAVRGDDVPARYGGEEFAVLLRNPSAEVALEVGERVRTSVARLDLSRLRVPSVSVSVGVAVAVDEVATIPDLIEQADRALYDAKRRGRDRVVAA